MVTNKSALLELASRAAVAQVRPRSVADSNAEHLSPRQIDMLYAASAWAYDVEAALRALAEKGE